MKSYIILSNCNDSKCRGFCALYGSEHNVVEWYKDPAARETYLSLGYPNPSGFPTVVDPDTKTAVVVEGTMADAIQAISDQEEAEANQPA